MISVQIESTNTIPQTSQTKITIHERKTGCTDFSWQKQPSVHLGGLHVSVCRLWLQNPRQAWISKATIESFCQWWWSNNQLHSYDIPISAYVSYALWTLHMLFGAMWLVHFTRRNIQSCTKNAERTILQKKKKSAIRSFLHRFEALIITIVTKRMWETYHTSILAWRKVSYHLQQTQIKQQWRS